MRSGRGMDGAALGVAALLFAAVTVLRFATEGVGGGYVLLYGIPIALLALWFGLAGGLAGALTAMGLFAVWAEVSSEAVDAAVWITRSLTFFLIGGLVGLEVEHRRRSERRNTRWFGMSNDMLCEASFDGYLTRLNGTWERVLGYSEDDLRGRPFIDFVHQEDRDATMAAAASLGQGNAEIVNFENRYRASDGSWRWLLWSSRSDDDRIYAVAKDITERKELEAERERLLARVEAIARTDELTGLANRRAWDEQLRLEMERVRRGGPSFAVAMLDLDRFKEFNDRHGHPAGDDLLRQAAAEWRMRLRVVDFLARYGGEEFALLLPGCPPGDAEAVVERVRAGTPMAQTVSAGIAYWDGEETAEDLIARADTALYEAKRGGRDRSVLATA